MTFPTLSAALTTHTSVVVEFGGRWFITIGNPGFNSPANNAQGYGSEAAARAAIRYYASRGTK